MSRFKLPHDTAVTLKPVWMSAVVHYRLKPYKSSQYFIILHLPKKVCEGLAMFKLYSVTLIQ